MIILASGSPRRRELLENMGIRDETGSKALTGFRCQGGTCGQFSLNFAKFIVNHPAVTPRAPQSGTLA